MATFQFYNRTSTAVNQTFFTNDRNCLQTYKGIEITVDQADVEPLADAGGLHVLEVAHRRVERQHEPELPDQCHGPTGGAGEHRWHELQRPDRRSAAPVQADRYLPDAVVGHRAGGQSQLAERRAVHAPGVGRADGRRQQHGQRRAAGARDGSTPGRSMDLRVFKVFNFGNRSLEASVDFNNS